MTDEHTQFLVEEQGEAVYIHRAHGEHAVRTDPGIGKRIPLQATSTGKAILAAMPPEELSRIIEQTSFNPLTDETITDPETLRDKLDRVRECGYAFNRQENLNGLHAVGVPVTGPDGRAIGGLSVAGPVTDSPGSGSKTTTPSYCLARQTSSSLTSLTRNEFRNAEQLI